MVDHRLTKGVILCSTNKTVTTEGIASLFFHKVYLRFHLYNRIISDHGPQFTSTFTKELGRILSYKLALSTAHHPQTDGEIDLQIYCRDNPTSWSDSISHAEFTHNHHPHSITEKFLFYLMMGFELRALPTVCPSSPLPTLEHKLNLLQAV